MEDKQALDFKESKKESILNKKTNNSKEENLKDIEKLMRHRSYKRHRGALKQISN